MQVCGLPRQIIRNGGAASRLLAAKTPNIVAERRRDAVARWRRAMGDGLTADQAARAVGVPRASLYRWQQRVEPRSRRPKRVRGKTWTSALMRAVERLRLDYPMWGRAKLGPLLRQQGFAVSDTTVGRIIAHLVKRGVVEPAPSLRKKGQRWTAKRRLAQRLPKDLRATEPGSLVQLDTVFITLAPGKAIKHFTAYDPRRNGRLARPSIAPRRSRPPASSTSSCVTCRSRSKLSRWTVDPSSWPSSKKLARPGISSSTSCRLNHLK